MRTPVASVYTDIVAILFYLASFTFNYISDISIVYITVFIVATAVVTTIAM